MSGAARYLCLCLMLGLVLPVCLKAFAPAALASNVAQSIDGDSSENPANAPCLSCCGGWTGLLPAFVVPEPRRDELSVLPKLDKQPLGQVSAAFAAQGPPPEWRLVTAQPHTYSNMHARTDRLLL